MANEEELVEEDVVSLAPAPVRSARRRILPLVLLACGGLGAAYFAANGRKDQHVRLVLGDAAPRVSGVTVQYIAADGDAAREVRLAWKPDDSPRVVALEPELPSGEYRLLIELDTREGRRSTERRVTLGGGTTSVDLTGFLGVPDQR